LAAINLPRLPYLLHDLGAACGTVHKVSAALYFLIVVGSGIPAQAALKALIRMDGLSGSLNFVILNRCSIRLEWQASVSDT
jgi:hypothetical protein